MVSDCHRSGATECPGSLIVVQGNFLYEMNCLSRIKSCPPELPWTPAALSGEFRQFSILRVMVIDERSGVKLHFLQELVIISLWLTTDVLSYWLSFEYSLSYLSKLGKGAGKNFHCMQYAIINRYQLLIGVRTCQWLELFYIHCQGFVLYGLGKLALAC